MATGSETGSELRLGFGDETRAPLDLSGTLSTLSNKKGKRKKRDSRRRSGSEEKIIYH